MTEGQKEEDQNEGPLDAFTELQNFHKLEQKRKLRETKKAEQAKANQSPVGVQHDKKRSMTELTTAREEAAVIPLAGSHMLSIQTSMNSFLERMRYQNKNMRQFTDALAIGNISSGGIYASAAGVIQNTPQFHSQPQPPQPGLKQAMSNTSGTKLVNNMVTNNVKDSVTAPKRVSSKPSSTGYDLG